MKKHFPKTISFLLVALLIVGIFVGCSNTGTNNTTNDKNTLLIIQLQIKMNQAIQELKKLSLLMNYQSIMAQMVNLHT